MSPGFFAVLMAAAARAGVVPPPPLVVPDLLLTGADGSTGNTVLTGSVSPSAGSLVVFHAVCRADGEDDVTWNALSAGFSIEGSWRLLQTRGFNAGTSRWLSSLTAIARASTSPGSGSITATLANAGWNKAYSIEEVPAGAAADLAAYPSAGAYGTGTSVTATLGATPAASSLLLGSAGHEASNVGAWTFPAGWTGRTPVTQSFNVALKTGYRLLGGAAANQLTGLDNNEGDAFVVTEVLQA